MFDRRDPETKKKSAAVIKLVGIIADSNALFGDLPLDGECYKVLIRIAEENKNMAHLDVALYVEDDGDKSKRETLKTNAGLALARAFGPPVGYICDCDHDDQYHPINQYGSSCLSPVDPIDSLVGPQQLLMERPAK